MQKFSLGTFKNGTGRAYVGLVSKQRIIPVADAYRRYRSAASRKARLKSPGSLLGLLGAWDRNFDALSELNDFALSKGLYEKGMRLSSRRKEGLTVLPPINRPSKMIYAGANYAKHVQDLRASGFKAKGADLSKDTFGEKETLQPYSWLKAPSTLTGAYDDIVLPPEEWDIDWEVELAFAIGRPAKRVSADKALEHIAGYMTTNDVSCRTLTFRSDRPAMRTDWLGGKSLDSFAPMGPFFVPRAFVKDHRNLSLKLKLNGELMQDGNTRDMIFGPEEQIEHASRLLTLEPGDVFATGSPEGNGQSRGFFLKPGDVIDAEVQGLGAMKNRVIGS